MSWLLPLSLVLLVGIVMGAGHMLFVRWMQHATAPEPIADSPSDQRGDHSSAAHRKLARSRRPSSR